jgi:hypothetical protein
MIKAALHAAAMLVLAVPVAAGELTLQFNDGHVTLAAKDVSVRQILMEWERLGNTKVVNADKVTGGPVTLELSGIPEKQALEVLLRSVAGYVAAPRAAETEGPSQFAHILLMPPSSAPPPRPSNRAPITRPPVMQQQMPVPQVLTDDQGNPVDPGAGPPGAVQDPESSEGQEGGETSESGDNGEGGVVVQPLDQPGIQPIPESGDPPPPDPAEAPVEDVEEPAAEETPSGPTATPNAGTLASPNPRQLPVPSPSRPRRR